MHLLLESSGVGEGREELIDAVADDILQKLPDLFVISNVKKMYEQNFTPSTVVLLQELERFNILIKKIRVTLTLLRKVSTICIQFRVNERNLEINLNYIIRLYWVKLDWILF